MPSALCLPNAFPEPLALPSQPPSLLHHALSHLVRASPPQTSHHSALRLSGVASGPTALAYLFLHLSAAHPSLTIAGHPAHHWAESYLRGSRGSTALKHGNCGITSEELSYAAVKACLSKNAPDLEVFIRFLDPVLDPSTSATFPSELLRGRAGALYLIRAVRHFVPSSAPRLETPASAISRRLLDAGDDGAGNWRFHGKHYLGAAHGDLGILTQLVLTTPSLAPELRPRLEALLAAQFESGNWPSSVENGADKLVQWCHGAAGFVVSLVAVREYFPQLGVDIDTAVERARECIWKRGLLRKEPSLCHGILGNGL